MPKITGVQAEGSSLIYKAITENSERVRFGPVDMTDSISLGLEKLGKGTEGDMGIRRHGSYGDR